MTVRVKRRLIRRAARAVDAADRVVTRAWRAQLTPEERMIALFPEGAPQTPSAPPPYPAPAGSRYSFMYEDTTVPPGVALEAWRKMRGS